MKSVFGIVLLGLCWATLGQAYFGGELKPFLQEAITGIKQDILAKGASMRSLNKLPEFFAAAVEEEAISRLQQFETSIHEYEKRTAEANAIIHQATEVLRNPPMEKMNYEALVAEDILRLMPKIQELTGQAQAALKRATEAAAALSMDSFTKAVSARLMDLQGRGLLSWIGDIITGGPNWIIENLAALASSLSPSNSISILMVQHIAQTILGAVGSLGSTLTEAGATNLLAFLGPFKEPLGNLYDQVVWSLQQTFPAIFDKN